jgi:hypothetical protein
VFSPEREDIFDDSVYVVVDVVVVVNDGRGEDDADNDNGAYA